MTARPSRLSVASRILAAFVGGYALTSLLSIAFALLLALFGMNKAEAVLATTIASFLIYAVIVMAVIHARTAARAWLGLGLVALPATAFAAVSEKTIPWMQLLLP
jgi:hypothetical protein